MPASSSHQVFEVLTATHADLERQALLGDGFQTALWRREQLEDVVYDRPEHHTLSLYLEDGFEVFLQGRPEQRGAPGKLCLLPAEQASTWQINGRIRFLHVYFSQQQLEHRMVRMLDREPRTLELQQRIYMQDPQLAAACSQLASLNWQALPTRLEANALSHEILSYLLLNFCGQRHHLKLRGGLSPSQRRRALDLIEAQLDSPLTLGDLAAELALSEYHFARMFRTSVGEAPHRWIMRRRLERARQALQHSHLSLPLIAHQHGFAHVSHLTRALQSQLGISPGAYRHWAQRQSPRH